MGLIIYKPENIKLLTDFKSQVVSDFKSGRDFILSGLLYNAEDKIRNDFKNALEALCMSLSTGDSNALNYMLQLLAQNFTEVSNRPCS